MLTCFSIVAHLHIIDNDIWRWNFPFISSGADWRQEESLPDGCRYLWCFFRPPVCVPLFLVVPWPSPCDILPNLSETAGSRGCGGQKARSARERHHQPGGVHPHSISPTERQRHKLSVSCSSWKQHPYHHPISVKGGPEQRACGWICQKSNSDHTAQTQGGAHT